MSLGFLSFREKGYTLLGGKGIEIGGFENPANIPNAEKIIRCDRLNREEAQKLFPEVNCSLLHEPDLIFDLDVVGLSHFADQSLDFIIINHVIEHLVNPVYAIEEIRRTLKRKGHFVISAPDKDYTFDLNRPLSDEKEIFETYLENETVAPIQKYLPLIEYIHTDLINAPIEEIEKKLKYFSDRREHLHIWNSETFKEFLVKSFDILNARFVCEFEVNSKENKFEYFGVWQKC